MAWGKLALFCGLVCNNFTNYMLLLTCQGPNVFGISNDVPQGCSVQQAAYIVRHGSR
jgi:hypothetical protein